VIPGGAFVAVDGSPEALAAGRVAVEIARCFGAELVALNVSVLLVRDER
jgi:hypothetical protein